MAEGAIKFFQEFKEASPVSYLLVKDIALWRSLFYETGLIGMQPNKYDGFGYGNLSKRVPPYNSPLRKRKFIITGSGTSGLEELKPEHYSTVLAYYPEQNKVISSGPIKASSESMTHGCLYDCDRTIKYVYHAHSPEIWENAKMLGIPVTDKSAEYGSVELVKEVSRLFRQEELRNIGIFAVGGHKDGVFSFGSTAKEAGLIMLGNLHHASKLQD